MANNFNPILAYGKKGSPITLINLKEFAKDKYLSKYIMIIAYATTKSTGYNFSS